MSEANDVKRLVSQLFALVYEDDGPSGICGQACSITNPWKRLYLFETEEKMREFARSVENSQGRLRPRISYGFYPEPLADKEINFVAG